MASQAPECLRVTDAEVTVGERTLLTVSSLVIRRGQRVSLTGASGSGKTTLLRLLAGLTAPPLTVSGDVARAGTLGFVAQDALGSLNPLVTCRRQVQLIAGDADQADAALQAAGITGEQARRHPLQLSGGQRQRVAISCAIARDPDVILADEPTSSLDPIATLSVVDALTAASERTGAAIIVATHDLGVARRMSDLHIHVTDGHITEMTHVDLV